MPKRGREQKEKDDNGINHGSPDILFLKDALSIIMIDKSEIDFKKWFAKAKEVYVALYTTPFTIFSDIDTNMDCSKFVISQFIPFTRFGSCLLIAVPLYDDIDKFPEVIYALQQTINAIERIRLEKWNPRYTLEKWLIYLGCKSPSRVTSDIEHHRSLYCILFATIHKLYDDEEDVLKRNKIVPTYNAQADAYGEPLLDVFEYCEIGREEDSDTEALEQLSIDCALIVQILMRETKAATDVAELLGVKHQFLRARFLLSEHRFTAELKGALDDFIDMEIKGYL